MPATEMQQPSGWANHTADNTNKRAVRVAFFNFLQSSDGATAMQADTRALAAAKRVALPALAILLLQWFGAFDSTLLNSLDFFAHLYPTRAHRFLEPIATAAWTLAWLYAAAYWLVPTRTALAWFGISCALIMALLGVATVSHLFSLWLPISAPLLGIVIVCLLTISVVFRNETAMREFVEVTRKVLDQLPEPIYVKDSYGRIRLVNESFCRLADALPEQLVGLPLETVFPDWHVLEQSENENAHLRQLHQSITTEAFTDLHGKHYQLQSVAAHLPRPGRQDLVFGLIRAFQATGREHDQPADADQLRHHFTSLCFWAGKHGQHPLLQLVKIEDFALLQEAYGIDTANAQLPLVRERLLRAFPDADHIVLDAELEGAFWLFRRSGFGDTRNEQTQRALDYAFQYQFAVAGELVNLNALCASASAPLDGTEFAELQSIIVNKLTHAADESSDVR
jgi:PAS domain-containing protein